MKSTLSKLLLGGSLTIGLVPTSPAHSQPPQFGDRGDRGGDRGDRGDRGGDRGSFGGDRGGFRGGPPMGGPGGGPPMMGGPGGGPPMMGGPGGGPPMMMGGSRGGFDPSSFLDRLDRNGNGMLDLDEMEGPAQFLVSRLQREDPSIRTDRPIPISKFKEAFDKMRAAREGGGDGGGFGGGDPRGGENSEQLNAAMTAAPLVPDFTGSAPSLPPVLGFGPAAELMSVEVTPADLKEAKDRLERYDRNRDGSLAGDELSSRWGGNPMDFDRNGDRALSLNELAVRAGRMRVAQAEVAASQNRKRDDRQRREGDQKPPEIADLYKGRKSFAVSRRATPEGLPGWFSERDANGDLQVSMSEYSKDWNDSLLNEFQKFDLNGDGMITAKECLAGVRNGASASGSSGGSRPSGLAMRGPGGPPGSPPAPGTPSGPAPPAAPLAPPSGAPDEKMVKAAEKVMKRTDKNGDSILTPDEWKDMLIDPSAADFDKDGRITLTEYAQWLQARSSR